MGCFGQDIFGNLFAFRNSGKVVFLNIETAEIEEIASDFKDWLEVFLCDVNYFTGVELIKDLNEVEAEELARGYRLCPKVPFVMGGSYQKENLYLKFSDKNINYNASIARQLVGLKDGQKVELKIIDKDD